MIVLGIETSCDETATAVCRDGVIISSHIRSQSIHEKYGGVIPEIASREHEKFLNEMVFDTLNDGGISRAPEPLVSSQHSPTYASPSVSPGSQTAQTFAPGALINTSPSATGYW